MTHDVASHVHDPDPPRGQYHSWTEDRIADLKRLHAEGFSCSIIGEKLGVSRNAIIGKVRRLGLSAPLVPRTWKPNPGNFSAKPKVPKQAKLKQPKAPKKPKANFESMRAVRANGNSNAMRLIRSLTTTPFQPRCVEIVPLHISLIDLEKDDCRYPYGDDQITFCGHPRIAKSPRYPAGSPYCFSHHALCNEPPRIPIQRFAGKDVAA